MAERWVTQIRGSWNGRTGLVLKVQRTKVLVQWGSGGPVSWLLRSSLRKASREEVAEKCVCKPRGLPKDLYDEHPSAASLEF